MKNQALDENCLLSPRQLSRRQLVSEKKLATDRQTGEGVPFLKIGRLCRYRLRDVVAWENERVRRSTSDNGGNND